MELDTSNISRNLLKELIELRQIKSERESILRTNQYYIAQVSQMEIKISELKATLQAKESEIMYLNQKIQEAEENHETNPKNNKLLEDQLVLLSAENEHLKIQLQEAGEISQLKIQLEYALKMKETFEEKYREAKTMLLTNKSVCQTDLSSEKEYPKSESASKLSDELEVVKKMLGQYQSQCSILSAENEELLKKLDTFEKESMTSRDKIESQPPKVKPAGKTITSPEPYKFVISSSSTNSSEFTKTITKGVETPVNKAASYAIIPKTFKLNSSKVAKSSMLPTQKSIIKSEVAEYCPSFMRNKKNDFKPTPSPSVKKNSINSFPDDFPYEFE